MPLQRPNPDPRKDVILELGLRGGRGYRGVPVGFDGKAAKLRLQCRHHRPAWQLSKAMSGRPDRHAAKLPGASGATPCSVMPGGSDRYATELRAAAATASAATHQVPGRPDRYAAKLRDTSGGDNVPGGSNRRPAELQGGSASDAAGVSRRNDRHASELCRCAADMSCWPNRHPAKLQGSSAPNAADVSCRYDGYSAELQSPNGTADLSGGNDGHAAELPGDPAADMPCRHDGHAAELPGDPAADMPCRHDRHAA